MLAGNHNGLNLKWTLVAADLPESISFSLSWTIGISLEAITSWTSSADTFKALIVTAFFNSFSCLVG